MRSMLKSKIHRARVTGVNLDYEGSITIDELLMEAADLLPYEMVQVLNVNNGARFQTYVIEGERASGEVAINGAAARLVCKGDTVLILSYSTLPDSEAQLIKPRVVYVDQYNSLLQVEEKSKVLQF